MGVSLRVIWFNPKIWSRRSQDGIDASDKEKAGTDYNTRANCINRYIKPRDLSEPVVSRQVIAK